MKIGIIIAMDNEYRQMLALLGGKKEGVYAGNELILWQCGIGKVNAAIGTAELIKQHNPDCIISTGLAGAVSDKVEVKDIVVASHTAYHDVWCGDPCIQGQVQGLPPVYESDSHLVEVAKQLDQSPLCTQQVHLGLACSGDEFVTTKERILAIRNNFPQALSCDMEAAAIAQTCYIYHIPNIAIRFISDCPAKTDNHKQQWADFISDMSSKSFLWLKQYLDILGQSSR